MTDTLTKHEAQAVLFHELLHAQYGMVAAAGWVCHREGDPEDRWVVDMMVGGSHVRIPPPQRTPDRVGPPSPAVRDGMEKPTILVAIASFYSDWGIDEEGDVDVFSEEAEEHVVGAFSTPEEAADALSAYVRDYPKLVDPGEEGYDNVDPIAYLTVFRVPLGAPVAKAEASATVPETDDREAVLAAILKGLANMEALVAAEQAAR